MTPHAETKKLIVTDLSDVEPYGLCLLIDRGAGVLYYPIRDMDKETALILLSEYANTDPEHVAYADEAWLSDETEPSGCWACGGSGIIRADGIAINCQNCNPPTVTEAVSAAYGDADWLCGTNYIAESDDWKDWTQTRESDRPL